MKIAFDTIVEKIAALGIPGLVLVVAMSVVGFEGAAAVTAALGALGGPLGMLGGIAVLGLLVLLAQAGAKFGYETIAKAVLRKQLDQGVSKVDILRAINGLPLSTALKDKLRKFVEESP